jgi:hypothetical protein
MSTPSEPQQPIAAKRSYGCFISYAPEDNSAIGRRWATWIHYQVLDKYKVPRNLIGTTNSRGGMIPERLPPVFREDDPVAEMELSPDIRRALEESQFLIVVCSPRAARSLYVGDQIRYFKQLGRDDFIISVIVDGDPEATPDSELECFPAALLHGVDEHGEIQVETEAQPKVFDFRLSDGTQGWTTPEIYRQALILADKLDSTAVDEAVAGYAGKCQLATTEFISFILANIGWDSGTRPSEKPTLEQGMAEWPTVKSSETISAPESEAAFVAGAAVTVQTISEEPAQKKDDVVYDENVQFSVYRPKVVVPGKWHTMLAFAHLAEKAADAPADAPDPVQEVARQAKQVLGNVDAYRESTQDSTQAIPRECEITLVPEVEGIKFNPLRRSFTWDEPVHREEFRLMTRDSAIETPKTLRGRMTIFLGTLIIAEIPLAFRIDTKEEPAASEPTEATQARPYRKVFASYSHRDMAVVEHLEHYAKALGDSYLRDILQLKPGEKWNPRLLAMIEEADIFQLFWSSNSMHSPYVRQEWEYALALNRPNFIRPTFWEDPLPTLPAQGLPPQTLRDLHFQKIESGRLPMQGVAEADDVVVPEPPKASPRIEAAMVAPPSVSAPRSVPREPAAAAPAPIAAVSSGSFSPAPPEPAHARAPRSSGGGGFGWQKIVAVVAVVAVVGGFGFHELGVSRPGPTSVADAGSAPAPQDTTASAPAPTPMPSAPNQNSQVVGSVEPESSDSASQRDWGDIFLKVLEVAALIVILVAVVAVVWQRHRRR